MPWRLRHALAGLGRGLRRRKWLTALVAVLVLCGASVGFLWWLGGQPPPVSDAVSLSAEETAALADSGVVVRCGGGEFVYRSDARGGKEVALSLAPGVVVQRGGRLLDGLPPIPEETHVLVLASGGRLLAVYWEE